MFIDKISVAVALSACGSIICIVLLSMMAIWSYTKAGFYKGEGDFAKAGENYSRAIVLSLFSVALVWANFYVILMLSTDMQYQIINKIAERG